MLVATYSAHMWNRPPSHINYVEDSVKVEKKKKFDASWFKKRRPQQLLLLPKEIKIEKGLGNNSGGKADYDWKREKRSQLKTGYLERLLY